MNTEETTECYRLLNGLLAKYPQSSKDILITLKDIAREYELWNKLTGEQFPYDKETKKESSRMVEEA